MLDRVLSLDRVTLIVFILTSVCVGTAVFLLLYALYTRRLAKPKQPAIKLKEEVPPASHRRVKKPAQVFGDQMITSSGHVILKGDLFVLTNGGVPIPGTACKVVGFDLTERDNPRVLTRTLSIPVAGVRPMRIHPDELMAAWARMEDPTEERFSGAPTAILPPAPDQVDTCAQCGNKKFISSPEGPTQCAQCGSLFAAS